ncbi:LysM peptidoglycan-binding domain-containing protein [Cohnella mopanensis]|uniref:LysM peptidoglycan-binding domain-containing protein n=1 Tax=Cohnella mopanensis TaxID=2911966 RepID=UPI0034E1A75D
MKIHMVKQGDSLYSIAQKYGVSLEDIVKANPDISNPDAIEVGMKVKVPSHPQTTLEVIHHHVVQQGDTLWKLSKSWGIQLTDMIKANPQLKNPNALLTGEVVNIPKPGHGNEASAGTMHGNPGSGKANTGMKQGTGAKANTGVQPLPAPAPAPPPVQITPVPPVVPTPAPAPVLPIAETKPIYGIEIQEHVDLFHQYPVPAVQATVQTETPHPYAYGYEHGYGMQQPAYVNPAQTEYGYGMQQPSYVNPAQAEYGYGMQQPSYVNPAQAEHGYGMQQPAYVNPAQAEYGYGMQQPSFVNPAQAEHGYGMPQPGIAPLTGYLGGHIGSLGSFGHQDISYSPPDSAASIPGLNSPVMPSGKPASGCKTCGGKSTWPSSYAAANAGATPYAESYPGMGYSDGRVPYGISPYSTVPYGFAPQAVSPAGTFPGANATPYYGASPMGDMPVGFNPMAEGLPGVANGGMNYQPYPYYGGMQAIPPIPPFPPMPPMPPMPPLGPLRGDQSSSDSLDIVEDEVSSKIVTVKKRQAKPKLKLAAARQSKPKRKESLPWIKW